MSTQDITTILHEPTCKERWAACWWCHAALCPKCPGVPSPELCRIHAPFARRRYDLSAEIDAFNDYIGEINAFEISEKVQVSHQIAEVGPQHECFIQTAYYFHYSDEVFLQFQTRYGGHRTSATITPRYWATLLKRVGIARIPKKG